MASENTERAEREGITFEILEHFGILATNQSGWTKELNFVSWNQAPAKYDIRDWDEGHEHMSRGVTLKAEEAKKLLDLLKGLKF